MLDFVGEHLAEEAGLEFDGAAVADFVSEYGMRDGVGEAFLVNFENDFAGGGLEPDGAPGLDEAVLVEHAVVEEGEGGAVGDDGAEFLHEVEGEGGFAVAGLVEEADEGIESAGLAGEGAVFGEEAVEEGEDGVDGVAGRAAVAFVEEKGKARFGVVVFFRAEHAGEIFEINAGGGALDAEEGDGVVGGEGGGGEPFEGFERVARGLDVVSLEEGALVADFAVDEESGVEEGSGRVGGVGKLGDAGGDVGEGVAAGHAVEEAAHGKVGDGDVVLAAGLDGGGGHLHRAEEGDVVEVDEAEGVDDLALVFDDEGFAFLGDVKLGGVEVEGAGFVVGCDEAADGLLGANLREADFGDEGPGVGRGVEEGGGAGGEDVEFELVGAGIFLCGEAGEQAAFVGQAERREGAARALGGIFQRRRNGLEDGGAGFGDFLPDPSDILGGEGEGDALAGGAVEDDALVAGIAVFAEQKDLQAELHFVGVPDGVAVVVGARGPAFVFDGDEGGGAVGVGFAFD